MLLLHALVLDFLDARTQRDIFYNLNIGDCSSHRIYLYFSQTQFVHQTVEIHVLDVHQFYLRVVSQKNVKRKCETVKNNISKIEQD